MGKKKVSQYPRTFSALPRLPGLNFGGIWGDWSPLLTHLAANYDWLHRVVGSKSVGVCPPLQLAPTLDVVATRLARKKNYYTASKSPPLSSTFFFLPLHLHLSKETITTE
jgi:hypothetical protein